MQANLATNFEAEPTKPGCDDQNSSPLQVLPIGSIPGSMHRQANNWNPVAGPADSLASKSAISDDDVPLLQYSQSGKTNSKRPRRVLRSQTQNSETKSEGGEPEKYEHAAEPVTKKTPPQNCRPCFDCVPG